MFNETLEVVENSEFNNIEFFAESAHGIPTHWEKQKILEGARIWRMRFRKKIIYHNKIPRNFDIKIK